MFGNPNDKKDESQNPSSGNKVVIKGREYDEDAIQGILDHSEGIINEWHERREPRNGDRPFKWSGNK